MNSLDEKAKTDKTYYRGWLYKDKQIHRYWFEKLRSSKKEKIGRDWYFLIYEKKIKFIFDILSNFRASKILDAGCGEGVLVEELKMKGYNIEGIDLNYESEFVKRGNIISLPYDDNSFDLVLLLDVLEHLPYDQQYKALSEIKRVLKNNGILIMSFPNIANLSSRIKFLLLGKLSRTDKDIFHLGERSFGEIKDILVKNKFKIIKIKSITPTFPIIWQLITLFPDKMKVIHNLINFFQLHSISLLNIFILQNEK